MRVAAERANVPCRSQNDERQQRADKQTQLQRKSSQRFARRKQREIQRQKYEKSFSISADLARNFRLLHSFFVQNSHENPVIHTLPNGLTVLALSQKERGVAAFSFLIPAGSASENPAQNGISNLLESTLFCGAQSPDGTPRDARAISDALDALGVERGSGADVEYTTFSGATLGVYLEAALEIYADILRRPTFPLSDFENQKQLALQAIRGLDDAPSRKLMVQLRRSWFESAHRHAAIGTLETVEALQIEQLRVDFARRYCPNGAILALAGNFEWPRLLEKIESLFGDWRGEKRRVEAPRIVEAPLREHVWSEREQVHIALAWRGVAPDDPQNYAYRLANGVLSGGMGARLFSEVREKRGLVYSVSASVSSHRDIGWTTAYAGTTAQRAQETLDVLVAELKKMEQGVAREELERARTKLLTSLVMGEESTRARASSMARDFWILGRVRSLDELETQIGAVTTQDIADFYARNPFENFSVVTLGPRALQCP